MKLSPRMFLARIACKSAQAHLDAAMSQDPADKAWAEVWDAFYAWVKAEPETPPS